MKFANGDKDAIAHERVEQRVGSYAKATGPLQLFQPAQISPDYMAPDDRFQKDFAAYDKEIRAKEKENKNKDYERRRLQNFDRDMKRWEFMEQQNQA